MASHDRWTMKSEVLSSRGDDDFHPLVQFLLIRCLEDIRVRRRKDRKRETMLPIS